MSLSENGKSQAGQTYLFPHHHPSRNHHWLCPPNQAPRSDPAVHSCGLNGSWFRFGVHRKGLEGIQYGRYGQTDALYLSDLESIVLALGRWVTKIPPPLTYTGICERGTSTTLITPCVWFSAVPWAWEGRDRSIWSSQWRRDNKTYKFSHKLWANKKYDNITMSTTIRGGFDTILTFT